LIPARLGHVCGKHNPLQAWPGARQEDCAMARRKQSRSENLIREFDCPVVAPEVLWEWVQQEAIRCAEEHREIVGDAASIREAEIPDKLQAGSTINNCQEFVQLAKIAEPLLRDDDLNRNPFVAMAFVAGLRLGFVYERLESIREGKWKRKWDQEDRCETMRDARSDVQESRRFKKQMLAIEALKWARDKFPIAAADESTDFLTEKAAEHLGIHARTLKRWLGGK
jgi:hypothetical protein